VSWKKDSAMLAWAKKFGSF